MTQVNLNNKYYKLAITVEIGHDGVHCGDYRFIKNGRLCSLFFDEVLEIDKVNEVYSCIRAGQCLCAESMDTSKVKEKLEQFEKERENYHLEACKKCGNQNPTMAVDIAHNSDHRIVCTLCANASQHFHSLDDAVDDWNKENA